MALRRRTAASLAVLVTVLAFPLSAAARPRTADAKAKKPHSAPQGVRSQTRLDGAALAEGGAGQRDEGSQPESDANAIVRWEDGDGGVHYTRRYEVPQRARSLRRVYTTVGTVPLDRTEAEKPAASPEGATSTATLGVIPLPPPSTSVPPAADAPQRVPSGSPQGSTTERGPPTSGATSR